MTMRNTAILALTLTVLLLGVAAGTALAQPDHAERDARKAHAAEMREARAAALASFHENRTEALAEYHAANNETKRSFLENKTRVIAECQAQKNMTGYGTTNETAAKHCMRDGLKPLIEKARAEHQAHREAFQERMKAARAAALEMFAQKRGAAARDADG